MKFSRWLCLLLLVPGCVYAQTTMGIYLQSQDCTDARLYFKLLLWGPIVEEIVFRAGIQKFLMRIKFSDATAIVITSFLFAFVHFAVAGYPGVLAVFIPSIILGWTYLRSATLLPAMVLHSAFNALFLVVMCGLGAVKST